MYAYDHEKYKNLNNKHANFPTVSMKDSMSNICYIELAQQNNFLLDSPYPGLFLSNVDWGEGKDSKIKMCLTSDF